MWEDIAKIFGFQKPEAPKPSPRPVPEQKAPEFQIRNIRAYGGIYEVEAEVYCIANNELIGTIKGDDEDELREEAETVIEGYRFRTRIIGRTIDL